MHIRRDRRQRSSRKAEMTRSKNKQRSTRTIETVQKRKPIGINSSAGDKRRLQKTIAMISVGLSYRVYSVPVVRKVAERYITFALSSPSPESDVLADARVEDVRPTLSSLSSSSACSRFSLSSKNPTDNSSTRSGPSSMRDPFVSPSLQPI